MVGIVVQNLIEIGAVVLIISKFYNLRVWLENAYSRPFCFVLGDMTHK